MITPFTANKTSPLPFAYDYDNRIYEFNPYVSPSGHRRKKQRRSRSISSDSDSISVSDTSSNSKNSITLDKMKIDLNFADDERDQYKAFLSESSSSDLDSLPDYSDDDDDSSPFSDDDADVTTATEFSSPERSELLDAPFIKRANQNIGCKLKRISDAASIPEYQSPSIFEVPEIVHRILKIVDAQTTQIPQEVAPISRNPSISRNMTNSSNSLKSPSSVKEKTSRGTLHNCLMVNRLFYQITKEIMNEKVMFGNESHFNKFVQSLDNCSTVLKPKILVMHKLFTAKQRAWELLESHIDYSNLEVLELYMCPKLYPKLPEKGTRLPKLKTLVITGSRVLDDRFLIKISQICPNLQVLDLRACELVSDYGIYNIGQKCTNLREINFGRKNRGSLITDLSCSVLIRNNRNLTTVGLAGCHITDKSIWDLALHCNTSLERLSLNNCPLITNRLIPLILHSDYFEKLSVLELRFVTTVTNWKPVIEFKRRQEFRGISMLVEVCDDLSRQMKTQELEMDRILSKRIFQDILIWMNEMDDGDLPYQRFFGSRNASQEVH